MTIGITVKTRRAPSQVPSIVKNVRSNSGRAAYNFARGATANARRRVHVITGALRASIHHQKVGPNHHKIIVGEHYGAYEEYGTRHRPPHPFLRPAIEDQKRLFRAEFIKVMHR